MTGTLYVLATPIGNLGDLSPRAVEVLRQVAVVAAEDTRETRKLLARAESSAALVSCHAHTPAAKLDRIVAVLLEGKDVAVTSDAGTPGVSDPGPLLVARARAAGCPVIPVPGPSAVSTALMAAGMPADHYVFMGFAPRKGGERDRWIGRIKTETSPVVCFEAPGRCATLLADLVRACGDDRQAFVAREMTKRFEEYRAGTLAELAAWADAAEVRGEVTLVVGPADAVEPVADPDAATRVAAALVEAGLERSRVARAVAQAYGLSRNESYRLIAERG